MGWKYVPGCNLARGADGDNNSKTFGTSRKSSPCQYFPAVSHTSRSFFVPPQPPLPYLEAVSAAKPTPVNAVVTKFGVEEKRRPLKVRKGDAGGTVVKLNKAYCPQIDVVAQLAKGGMPSARLQFNEPDLFPVEDEGMRELYYQEPIQLVSSSNLCRALAPSPPWRYLQKSFSNPRQNPIVHSENNATEPMWQQERVGTAALTRDAQCQTVCEAEVQTDFIKAQGSTQCQFQELDALTITSISMDLSVGRSESEESNQHKRTKTGLHETSRKQKKGVCTAHADKHKKCGLKNQGHWHANSCRVVKGKKAARKNRRCPKTKTGVQEGDECMSLHISKQLPVRPVQPADSSMGADEISNASHSFIASFSLPNDKVPVEVVGHCPQPRCIPNIQPMASKQTVHHVEETQYPGALSQATRVPYPNTDRISPRAETCVPSLSILDMSIGDADSSPIPRSPKDIGDAMASHHCPHIEKTVNTQMGRNSLESLAELERLIEEQHRELVARGILPADDDILDTSVQAEVDSDAKSFSRHLSAIRKVACGDQDSLQFTQNRDESDQIEFSRFRTGQSANIADADGFPSNVSGCFEAQGYQQIPDSIRKLSEIGKKFNQGFKCLEESTTSSEEIEDSILQLESELHSGSQTQAETKSSELAGMVASAAAVAVTHGFDQTRLAANTTFNVDIL